MGPAIWHDITERNGSVYNSELPSFKVTLSSPGIYLAKIMYLTFMAVREEEDSASSTVEGGEVVYYHSWVLCNAAFENAHIVSSSNPAQATPI